MKYLLIILLLAGNVIPVFALEIVPIMIHENPWAISINSATNKVYVTNSGNSTVAVVDGDTNSVKFLTVGQNPTGIVINPFTNLIYVSMFSSPTVSVINGTTDTIIANITVGKLPNLLGLDTEMNKIYVSNSGEKSVSVIDGNTNTVSKTIILDDQPAGIAVNPLTHLAYVANAGNVSVIDKTTDTISETIAVGSGQLTGIAVNPSTDRIYVSDISDTVVFVIDTNSNTVVTKIKVGNNPDGVTVNPSTNKIYVANSGDGSVSVIDGDTNTVSDTISVGTHMFAIAVNPVSGVIYTANDSPGILYVISDIGKSENLEGSGTIRDDETDTDYDVLPGETEIIVPVLPEQELRQGVNETKPKPKIPDWVKNTMQWFSEGLISEQEMINGIQFLVSEGIINIEEPVQEPKVEVVEAKLSDDSKNVKIKADLFGFDVKDISKLVVSVYLLDFETGNTVFTKIVGETKKVIQQNEGEEKIKVGELVINEKDKEKNTSQIELDVELIKGGDKERLECWC
jgi:YVTN family beta-propeller protein